MLVGIGEISGACGAIAVMAMFGIRLCVLDTGEWVIVRVAWWLIVDDYRWVWWCGWWVADCGYRVW